MSSVKISCETAKSTSPRSWVYYRVVFHIPHRRHIPGRNLRPRLHSIVPEHSSDRAHLPFLCDSAILLDTAVHPPARNPSSRALHPPREIPQPTHRVIPGVHHDQQSRHPPAQPVAAGRAGAHEDLPRQSALHARGRGHAIARVLREFPVDVVESRDALYPRPDCRVCGWRGGTDGDHGRTQVCHSGNGHIRV